jgi:hypothetical protein
MSDCTRMVHFTPEISHSTDSEQTTAQVSTWLKECSDHHQACRKAHPTSHFLPSRLVQISGTDEVHLSMRLCEKMNLPQDVRYASLSHCWGSKMPFVLNGENFGKCLTSFPMNEVSRVFRDAAKVAWRVGIEYIWIDSLCEF